MKEPMVIVFLAPFGIRPKGTVIARMIPLAAGLQSLGHRVTIVAPPYTNPEDSGKVEVVGGVTVKNIFLGPRNRALATPVLTWRMLHAALAEKPDLVHLFKPKGYGGLAAMLQLCCERIGIRMPPLFLDTDDWEGEGGMNDLHSYSMIEKHLFAFQEKWLSRKSAGVTVASRELQKLAEGLGVLAGRILYLPNCVDDLSPGDGVPVREKLGIPFDAPVLLLYTRFFEFSQNRLHLVFSAIHHQISDIRFLVVGKGRYGEEYALQAASHSMGFPEALVMAGWVEPKHISDYLAAADVAIYPLDDTLINRAKCPAKLTELLRAGVPVVADGVGQATEYVRPGISGILCDPEAISDMVEQAVELLRNTDKRRELGKAGRQFLLDNFAWKDAAVALDSFYEARVAEKK